MPCAICTGTVPSGDTAHVTRRAVKKPTLWQPGHGRGLGHFSRHLQVMLEASQQDDGVYVEVS